MTMEGERDGGPAGAAVESYLRQLRPQVWSMVDGINVNDEEGRYVYVSPSYCQLVGYTKEELLGESFLKVIPSEFQSICDEIYTSSVKGELSGETGMRGEFELQRKDGRRLTVSTYQVALSADRPLRGFLIRDITRQKALQEDLLRADRIRTLRTLAGSVAHEFNNLLVSILGYAEMIERGGELDSEAVRDYAAKIRRTSQRGTELTAQLLPFARSEADQRERVDLHQILSQAAALTRAAAEQDERIPRLELRLGAPQPIVRGDAIQLRQVFVNLFRNAFDAMPEGGLLRVQTAEVQEPQRRQSRTGEAGSEALPVSPVSYVLVTVSDTGAGMEGSVLERMREPFFTTKSGGKGIGLGMALVFSSAESHGGWVEVESRPRCGCTVRLWLPTLAEPRPA